MPFGLNSAMVLILSAASLLAQADDPGGPCNEYLKTPLPAEAAAIETPKTWPDCNSYKLYSGIGTKVDFDAARKCAWKERLAIQAGLEPKYTVASIVGGSAMLAVLYANGEGVEQSKPLALRFACEAEVSPPGLKDIEALPEQAHLATKKFRYCDEAYTTFEMNYCAAYDAEIAAQKRRDAMDSLSRNWPPEHLGAFKALEDAEEKYVEAHGRGEVYQGGTIRNLRTNGVEERQRDKFLAAVQEFESGHLPKGTVGDFKKADAELHAIYQKAMKLAAVPKEYDDGFSKPDGIRSAERAWLRYRDAWVEFAKLHYPGTDSNAWLTLLTTNRISSLRATACDVGWDDRACKHE